MKTKQLKLTPRKMAMLGVALSGALLVASAARADHNSIWGEGWANMPNDIHDTRIDTLGDNEAFTDFVSARDDVVPAEMAAEAVEAARDSVQLGRP